MKKTEIELPLTSGIVIFGIHTKTYMNKVRNLILLLTKLYIFRIKLNNEKPNMVALKHYITENLNIERNIFFKNNSLEKSETCWGPWKAIID